MMRIQDKRIKGFSNTTHSSLVPEIIVNTIISARALYCSKYAYCLDIDYIIFKIFQSSAIFTPSLQVPN